MADSNRNKLDRKHASEDNHSKVNECSSLRNKYSLTLGQSCYPEINFNDTLTGCEDISPILGGISNESLLAIADLDNILTGKGNVQESVNNTVTDGKGNVQKSVNNTVTN